jgi:PIN domain nuclease of toxin-antitoxin system
VKALLDTHAFLWWVEDDARLSAAAREAISRTDNRILLSVVSVWEILVKAALGRLTVDGAVGERIPEQIDRNGFEVLPVHLRHALRLGRLPEVHRDPFDRMLVAQAIEDDLPFITGDRAVSRYPIEVVW